MNILLLEILMTLSFVIESTNKNYIPQLIRKHGQQTNKRKLLFATADLRTSDMGDWCPTETDEDKCYSYEVYSAQYKCWANCLTVLTWDDSDSACSGSYTNRWFYCDTDCCDIKNGYTNSISTIPTTVLKVTTITATTASPTTTKSTTTTTTTTIPTTTTTTTTTTEESIPEKVCVTSTNDFFNGEYTHTETYHDGQISWYAREAPNCSQCTDGKMYIQRWYSDKFYYARSGSTCYFNTRDIDLVIEPNACD